MNPVVAAVLAVAAIAVLVAAARRRDEAAALIKGLVWRTVRRLSRLNLPMAAILLPLVWICVSANPGAANLRGKVAEQLRGTASAIRESRPVEDALPAGCSRRADGGVSCARSGARNSGSAD